MAILRIYKHKCSTNNRKYITILRRPGCMIEDWTSVSPTVSSLFADDVPVVLGIYIELHECHPAQLWSHTIT